MSNGLGLFGTHFWQAFICQPVSSQCYFIYAVFDFAGLPFFDASSSNGLVMFPEKAK